MYCGDCRDVLPLLSGVSAVVTDPPYGLGFMGKPWDASIPAIWEPLLGACLPGAHLLAFGGTRTHHRLMCAIEDAGWEIRDCLMWVYGSGFPKSHNISKAIDKAAGAEPVPTGETKRASIQRNGTGETWKAGAFASHPEETKRVPVTVPATEAARLWDGWGTALKPAVEIIVLAMKPLDGTFAANALEHGVAGINVDGCRVGNFTPQPHSGGMERLNAANQKQSYRPNAYQKGRDGEASADKRYTDNGATDFSATPGPRGGSPSGRWPTNLIHDGSEEVVAGFPCTKSGALNAGHKRGNGTGNSFTGGGGVVSGNYGNDSGSAARFFYCAKADKAERGKGNTHPTVKPLDLMSYLCKLISQPRHAGTLLDPFAGSGSTLLAASRWFERVIGIEREEKYCEIAANRLRQGVLF